MILHKMIPKIIHYCWFGRGEMPQLSKDCIASWHKHMPDWEYRLWNEDNFDIDVLPYTKEAYEAKKYAFVTDYVRLYALQHIGGVYMDVDVEVLKPLDDLMELSAFTGYEGSKYLPPVTGILASMAHGEWVTEQSEAYKNRHFVCPDGSYDLTTNTQAMTAIMKRNGFVSDGQYQVYKDLHIFPVNYFCPRQTTGEVLMDDHTYCDHHFMGSWSDHAGGWKSHLKTIIGSRNMTRLIKLKRALER